MSLIFCYIVTKSEFYVCLNVFQVIVCSFISGGNKCIQIQILILIVNYYKLLNYLIREVLAWCVLTVVDIAKKLNTIPHIEKGAPRIVKFSSLENN